MTWTDEQTDLLNAIQEPLDSAFETNVVVYVDAKAG